MKSLCAGQTKLDSSEKPVQYLRLNKEMRFNDFSWGRYTIIEEKSPGFILDEDTIKQDENVTEKKRKDVLEDFQLAKERGQTFALIMGYPCTLSKDDYYLLDEPPLHCVGEII